MLRLKHMGDFLRGRSTSGNIYSLVCCTCGEYSVREHSPRTHAEPAFGLSKNRCAFFGPTTTSLWAKICSRFSIIQRTTIADAHASIQASSSTLIALEKLFDRFSSASSASSSDLCDASNKNSSCGRGMARDLVLSSDKAFEMWGLSSVGFSTFRDCYANV